MQKRKILITGSSGTIGSYIPSVFTDDKLFLKTKKDLDVTDRKCVMQTFYDICPTVVIHLAAKTNVDACEKEKSEAFRINTFGTLNVAEACAQINARLVYLSSGQIFDGKKNYYTEKEKPNPINVYGKTKLLGEEMIQEVTNNYIIIRAGWVIGGSKREKKFISYVLQQLQKGNKKINVVNDKFGTITYAKELVTFIKLILEKKKSKGVYHFSSKGTCSRYAIANYLVKLLHKNVTITPVSSKTFAKSFYAPRPTHEVLRSIRFVPSFFNSWKESLVSYVRDELQYE